MEFELYGDDSRGVLRLDPRTKIFIFLVSSICSMYAFGVTPALVLGGVLCLVVALCGKVSFAVKSFLGLFVCIWVRYWIEASGFGAAGMVELLANLISIVLFTLPFLVSLVLLIQTTRISHLISALSAMHVPLGAIIPLAVMLRFIPAVQDEWKGIRKAMAMRGIVLDLPHVARAPFKAIEYVLVPLLMSTVSMMEELASAALARGLDSRRGRTSYEEVRMRPADWAVLTVFAVIAAYLVMFGRAGF